MDQQSLFTVPCHFQIVIQLEQNGTWTLATMKAYEGQSIGAVERETYAALSLSECVDVIAGTLFTI